MELQKAYEIYQNNMAEELKTLGFVKKSQNRFSRKVGNCRQDICTMRTMGRGIPSHDSVICSVLYSFDNINRIYYYIQGLPLRKGFPTGRILRIDEDLKYRKENHLREHFFFEGPNQNEIDDFAKYMRRENSSELRETDEELLWRFAKEDAERIQKSYLPLLDKCDTEEKFFNNLENDILIKHSITCEDSRMWYRIAALLSLGNKEAACELFDNWEPVSWRPTRKLPEDEKQEVKRRMIGLDEKKIPKQYILFGLQPVGGVLPVDTSER